MFLSLSWGGEEMKKFFESRDYRLGDLIVDILTVIAVAIFAVSAFFPIIQSAIAGWFNASPAEVVFF